MLFVAESTRELLVNKPPDLVPVGEFEIRGRRAKLRVWSVPDPPETPVAAGGTPAGEDSQIDLVANAPARR
jgi:class 3 adenylate cyclase